LIELTVFALKLQEAMDSGEGRKQKVTTATGGGQIKKKPRQLAGLFHELEAHLLNLSLQLMWPSCSSRFHHQDESSIGH